MRPCVGRLDQATVSEPHGRSHQGSLLVVHWSEPRATLAGWHDEPASSGARPVSRGVVTALKRNLIVGGLTERVERPHRPATATATASAFAHDGLGGQGPRPHAERTTCG